MSAEDLGGFDHSIDTWSWVKEWTDQITDAMRETVADQAKATARIAKHIKTSKAQHRAYADFLNFLLSKLSDELIEKMRALFFTNKDQKTKISYTRKTTNYPILIWLFVPFFRSEIIEHKMRSLYEEIYNPTLTLTPRSYVQYLKRLAHSMHDNIALDQKLLLQCIMIIIKEFDLTDPQKLEETQVAEIKSLIQKELF